MFKQAFRSYMASLHPRNYRKIKDVFLNWMCMVYAAVYHFIASAAKISIAEGESVIGLFFFYLVPLSIMIIMDIAILKTRYKGTMIDAWNYEESYNVLGKIKN